VQSNFWWISDEITCKLPVNYRKFLPKTGASDMYSLWSWLTTWQWCSLSTLSAISESGHIKTVLENPQRLGGTFGEHQSRDVTGIWFKRLTCMFSALILSFFPFLLISSFFFFFTMSSPAPTSFTDELDDLMRSSPAPSEDTLTLDTRAGAAVPTQTDSSTIDTSIPSSIGPLHNEMAYACHLARQNKLNVTQRTLLDELAQVCV